MTIWMLRMKKNRHSEDGRGPVSRVSVSGAICGILAVGIWTLPGNARACREVPLCVQIETMFEDGDATIDGTLDITEGGALPHGVMRARGLRVDILRPYPEHPLGLWLDQDGCTTFESQFHAGFHVKLHPAVLLGQNNNIRIIADDMDNPDPDVCVMDPLTDENDMMVCTIPYSKRWNWIAAAAHTVHRLDNATEMGTSLLSQDEELLITNSDVFGSFTDLSVDTYFAGALSIRHRYGVAHETGHWIHGQANMAFDADTESWATFYAYPPQDDPCVFAPPAVLAAVEGHGIRSAEFTSSALAEGFAQFVASVAFNEITSEEGTFKYYKRIDPEEAPAYLDFVETDHYRVSLQGGELESTLGGRSAWVENECSNDFAEPQTSGEDITSEIDWMRFFWRLVTADETEYGTAMDFWEVATLLGFTDANDPWLFDEGYCNLYRSLLDEQSGLASHDDRFVDLTAENGVSFDSPSNCL